MSTLIGKRRGKRERLRIQERVTFAPKTTVRFLAPALLPFGERIVTGGGVPYALRDV